MDEIPFQYKSVKSGTEGLYKDRGSKFHSYLLPVKDLEEVATHLDEIAAIHPKSRHVCYAYRLGISGEPYRYNDDGEPSGTAGRPIHNELLSNELSDVLCAVVRYFGGTKLGVPGLIKAYKGAAIDAMSQAEVVTISLSKSVRIDYKIEDMGKMYDLLKARGFKDIASHFDPSPYLIIDVPLNELDLIRQHILADYYGYGVDDITEGFESEQVVVEIC